MIPCQHLFRWDRTWKGWYSEQAMSCMTKVSCASISCRSKRLPYPPKFLYQICRTPYPPIQWTMGSSFPSNKAAMVWSWPNTSIRSRMCVALSEHPHTHSWHCNYTHRDNCTFTKWQEFSSSIQARDERILVTSQHFQRKHVQVPLVLALVMFQT